MPLYYWVSDITWNSCCLIAKHGLLLSVIGIGIQFHIFNISFRSSTAGIRAPDDETETNEVDESGLTAAERDKLRAERHKERQRDRNLARAAPDKR